MSRTTIPVITAAAVTLAAVLMSGCASSAQQGGTVSSASGRPKLRVSSMDKTGSSGDFASLDSIAVVDGLPKKLRVYKVVPANVERSWVEARKSDLGIAGQIAEDSEVYVAKGMARVLEVDKTSGSFDYTTDALSAQSEPIEELLSDDEYRARAESFLDRKSVV